MLTYVSAENYATIYCTSDGTPSLRHALSGNYPLIAFASALEEYKSSQSFQKIILYSKKLLEGSMALINGGENGQDQMYFETMGMEDFIGQSFRLKAKPQTP